MTVYSEIEYATVAYERTNAGYGIRCDNTDILCNSEAYYCDGSVAFAKVEHSTVTYEDIEYASGYALNPDGSDMLNPDGSPAENPQ